MSSTPLKKRRATILVTGPQSKTRIYDEIPEQEGNQNQQSQPTLQDISIARQRLHNELAVVNTASGIEILMQIVMDELEIMRMRIRENGDRMRLFFRNHLGGNQIRALLLRIFSNSLNRRNMLQNEARQILNELKHDEVRATYKMPRYTLNELAEVLMSDDLEDGVIQRRSPKWSRLPERQKTLEEDEDVFSQLRKLNVPMSMTMDEDDEERFSMPSTRTQMTTEDQMASIQSQLAMLSKQLMSLQKGGTLKSERTSSRASSRRGGRRMDKKPSLELTSSSSSSADVSEDEGKGPSVCSPSLTTKLSSTSTSTIAPICSAPPPPPPPPPTLPKLPLSEVRVENTPSKPALKPMPKSLPPAEVVTSSRPYLTDIANGRSLLKKTVRSPGGSPSAVLRHPKRAVSSFEAALRDRFRGFHGDTSFSEQEENGDDEDVNATWDE